MLSFFGFRVRINSQSFESVGAAMEKILQTSGSQQEQCCRLGGILEICGVSIVLVMIVGTRGMKRVEPLLLDVLPCGLSHRMRHCPMSSIISEGPSGPVYKNRFIHFKDLFIISGPESISILYINTFFFHDFIYIEFSRAATTG